PKTLTSADPDWVASPLPILDSRGSPRRGCFSATTPRSVDLGVFCGLGCDWRARGVDVCPWAVGVGQDGPRHDEGPEWKSGPKSSVSDFVSCYCRMRGCSPICIWPDPTGCSRSRSRS